ncbi:hypothetical protein EV652_103267 [Kribbella steppae]|uniref:Copper(I)-binding protein n=1 Tax=Kribbella steppae TaxID=2512223 RepID=A0A4R2HRX8_9ACTN|nr:hypothetical protein [Kribbella steppae]TCO33268.1 hypothetical protein EV652_103267 [Kribbella steppae]
MPITLSSRSVRRAALAGAAATLSIVLTACGASFNAQTSQPYQPAEGTNADSGSIAVRNVLVLASEDGKGELHAVIVNNGGSDDTLVGIEQAPPETEDGQAGGDQPTEVTFGNVKPLDLKAGTSTVLPPATGAEAESGEASGEPITVTGAKPGQMVNVVITFGEAGPITAYVPVLTQDHYSPSPRDDGESHG